MVIESDDVRRRAAVHAALADPARLAVVDELVVGDRSPGELGGALGLPSNLLAHHLKVLQEAGLVTRARSEADRRRTYLRLVPAALAALVPAAVLPAPRVVFVCTHNSARSQLAAALWRERTGGHADSAGTHPAEEVHPGAVAAAKRAGIDLTGARPRALRPADTRADVVVTVCDRAHEELGAPDRWLHWSIPDPVGAGRARAFDAALVELDQRIGAIASPAAGPADQRRP
jgi:ArsR family transcriptional regulator, arsenate/arsenite/antimonite-responsive transcriptional repressor / arsenate reductase (thioredoxin)